MKTKIFIKIGLLVLILLNGVIMTHAQEGAITFKSGIIVAMRTEIMSVNSQNSQLGKFSIVDWSATADGKDIVHRVIKDAKNNIHISYDLEIVPQPEKEKFKVLIKPSPAAQKGVSDTGPEPGKILIKNPNQILVNDGDIISFDILENPRTSEKVTDLIKITRNRREFGDYFIERMPAKDFTVDAVGINLVNFEVFINNEKLLKFNGGARTPLVHVYFKNKGRFIFSLFARPGYNFQKIGLIEDNKITFTYNGTNYKFVSSLPIVNQGGKWNLWVLYDANYESLYSSTSEIEVGAAQRIEYLYKSKE